MLDEEIKGMAEKKAPIVDRKKGEGRAKEERNKLEDKDKNRITGQERLERPHYPNRKSNNALTNNTLKTPTKILSMLLFSPHSPHLAVTTKADDI